MTDATGVGKLGLLACEEGCDPIEDHLPATLRSTIEAVFDEELDAFLARLKDTRLQGEGKGYRHGRRQRQLTTLLASVSPSSGSQEPSLTVNRTQAARQRQGSPPG